MLKYTLFENAFRSKSMLKAELEDVQRIADTNSSGAVDPTEWKAFQHLFVEQFKACDKNDDWKIDSKEGPACFVEQQWWKDLNVDGDNAPEMASQAPHQGDSTKASSFVDMMQAMDRNHDGDLNFAEQLFLRKTVSAWRRCVTGWGMNWKEVKCGLRVTAIVRGSGINDGEARKIALHALTWMQIGAKRISLPVFARLAQYQNMFQTYCFPVFDCRVSKATLMRNIELQTVPNALTPLQASYVDVFQDAFRSKALGFDQFCSMMYWIEKFTAQAGPDTLLNTDEFYTFLNDRTFDWKMRATIDQAPSAIDPKFYENLRDNSDPPTSFKKGKDNRANAENMQSIFNRSTTQESNQASISEGDFFHTASNFLQVDANSADDAYKGITAPPVTATDGPKARKTIFNILDVNLDGELTLAEFFTLIKYYNVFNYLAGNAYKQNPQSINNLDQTRNKDAIEKGIVTGFPSENQLNILHSLTTMLIFSELNFKQFLAKFLQRTALRPREMPNTQQAVSLVNLMLVLSRQDLQVPNPNEFLSKCLTFGGNSGVSAQNYTKAVTWALVMEQKAILAMNADNTNKEFNLNIDKYKDIENKFAAFDKESSSYDFKKQRY